MKASLDKLNTLHDKVADRFLAMLENEEVAAKDLAIIVKFLKDNDITVDVLESAPVQDIISSMKKNAVAYDDLDDLLESC